MMSDPMLDRIQREAGIPELIDTLVERLSPTDLQSLLQRTAQKAPLFLRRG
jgi:hypothetical protein